MSVTLNFASILAIVFITLKLCGVIAWSWWWVLCPLWLGFALLLLSVGICAAMYVIGSLLQKIGK